jgi:putative transposase
MNHYIHPMALFRLSVIGPLTSRDSLDHGELKKIVRELSVKTYDIPNSKRVHIDGKTIERWFYQWRKHGIDGLNPKNRSDKGISQLPKDIQQKLLALKKENSKRSLNTLIRLLEMQGHIQKNQIARATIHRFLKVHGLSKPENQSDTTIERRAFEALFAGDIWYGDVMYGPRIQTKNGIEKTYLVSIMDDASRLICHSAFCLDETALSIEFILKEALLKRGMPKKLVIDNGSAYRSNSLQSVCARLNIQIIYCRPYEPEGKGKLERFHRTFRDQFLTEINIKDIQCLDDLNARLWVWIEKIYHQTPHSALKENTTPLTRFQKDLIKIKPLGHFAENLDKYFYHRIKRRVKKDSTISYDGGLYEVSCSLVNQDVLLVFDPHDKKPKWIESMHNERISEVYLLDKYANNQRIRHRSKTKNEDEKANTTPKTSLIELAFELQKKALGITINS